MIKKYLPKIIISSIITLLPIAFGLIMWDKLPEKMAIHFNAAGEADGFASRAVAVFSLPITMSVLNIFCLAMTMLDPKRRNIDGKPMGMVIWLVPAISFVTSALIYAFALSEGLSISTILTAFIGLVFIIMGNYLPKCGQNYTLGIRTPWTLQDADTWKATHRFSGRMFMIIGLLTIILAFFTNGIWIMVALMIAASVSMYAYSYFYYTKHAEKEENN